MTDGMHPMTQYVKRLNKGRRASLFSAFPPFSCLLSPVVFAAPLSVDKQLLVWCQC